MQQEGSNEKIVLFIRQNLLVSLLVLFLLIDILFAPFIFFQNEKENISDQSSRKVIRISEIDGPRIDIQAASVEKKGDRVEKVSHSVLPPRIWMFLLMAYGALLIFNLTYNFILAVKIQWFWELLYTLIALATWFILDRESINIWYPMFVLKTGISIYAIYVYFFDKKNKFGRLF